MQRGIDITEGTVIRGKWYKDRFIFKRKLGEGGTSVILLVEDMSTGKNFAMKMSRDMVAIHNEYSILSRLKGVKYIPEVYYMDDCIIEGVPLFFLLMPYYRGGNLREVCKEKKPSIRTVLQTVLIAASICNYLNSRGIYYCDLKPENMVFDYQSGYLYLIDFGGVVNKGEAVFQFTPPFDRASWGKGERIADDEYQIFALSMILVELLIGVPDRSSKDFSKLLQIINNSGLCKSLKRVIIKGLGQEYDNLPAFQKDIALIIKDMGTAAPLHNKRKAEIAINLVLILSFLFFGIILCWAN